MYVIKLKLHKTKSLLLRSLSVLLAISLVVVQTKNSSAKVIEVGIPSIDVSVFELDINGLNNAMNELHELENFLDLNPGISYKALLESNSTLIKNIGDSSLPLGMAQEGEPPLGIPSFLWGCVFGLVGILIVYMITDNDKAQVKKALVGCVFYTVTIAAIYVVYFLWLLDESSDYYY